MQTREAADRSDAALSRYVGEEGERYFAWQRASSTGAGPVEARKFSEHVPPTARVLDFGCGQGELLLALPCAERIGVEPNPAARAVCASRGLAVAESLAEIPDASVDVVISNHALEHVPHPLRSLQELRRVLAPGGRVVLCLPFDDWRRQRRYDPKDINLHLYTWSPLLIGNLLAQAGFSVSRTWMLTHAWPPGWRALDRRLPRAAFDLVCRLYSVLRRQRQVMALAAKPE
jgi:SAM-dependent methyltransferase